MGQGDVTVGKCAQQSGLGHAAGDDESELHDSDRSVVEGFMSVMSSAMDRFQPKVTDHMRL